MHLTPRTDRSPVVFLRALQRLGVNVKHPRTRGENYDLWRRMTEGQRRELSRVFMLHHRQGNSVTPEGWIWMVLSRLGAEDGYEEMSKFVIRLIMQLEEVTGSWTAAERANVEIELGLVEDGP